MKFDPIVKRKKLGQSQQQFWARFGVTQSAGSRYESGRAIPKPVRMLLQLDGTVNGITDGKLAKKV